MYIIMSHSHENWDCKQLYMYNYVHVHVLHHVQYMYIIHVHSQKFLHAIQITVYMTCTYMYHIKLIMFAEKKTTKYMYMYFCIIIMFI